MRGRQSLFWVIVVVVFLLSVTLVYAKPGDVTVRVIDVDSKGREKFVTGARVCLMKPGEKPFPTPTEPEPGIPLKEGLSGKGGKVTFSGCTPDTTYDIWVLGPDGEWYGPTTFKTNANGSAGMQPVYV